MGERRVIMSPSTMSDRVNGVGRIQAELYDRMAFMRAFVVVERFGVCVSG